MKFPFWTGFLLVILLWYGGRYFYFQPTFDVREQAPDFETTLLNGAPFKLKDVRGNHVLVHFWGSWCRPCRQENPALMAIYNQYQEKKFTIIGIAIEKNPANWRLAIERDRLSYPYHILDQTSNFKFFDAPLSKLYGVKQLPSNFLLDERGMIIAINLTPPQLETYLKEKL